MTSASAAKDSDPIYIWLSQAYHYYVTYDNYMSDGEWDMLGRRIQRDWDKLHSPFKQYLEDRYDPNDENCFHTAFDMPWELLKKDGLQ